MNVDNYVKDNLPNNQGIKEWSISIAYRGSIAHNMYIPNSIDDIDIIGICIPPLEYYCGLKEYGSRGTVEIKEGKLDIVVFELKKLITMLSSCNPNVLSLLWLKEEHYIHTTKAMKTLIENREMFLSKQVYNSFTGYAHNQLSNLNKDSYKGYMGEKRKKLVDKFGFDVKNASHLIRLLRMGKEILSTHQVNVWREDREELLEIKTGKWPLQRILEESKKLFSECDELLEKSTLPKRTDTDKISTLCSEIIKDFLISK